MNINLNKINIKRARDRQGETLNKGLGLIYDPFLRNNLNETQVNTKNGRRTTVSKEISRLLTPKFSLF